jgi:hypothetical protein
MGHLLLLTPISIQLLDQILPKAKDPYSYSMSGQNTVENSFGGTKAM